MTGKQRAVVTPPPQGRLRLLRLVIAAAAAIAVFAGLMLHGLPGAVLLSVVALGLVSLSVRVWPALTPVQRVARAVIVLALLLLAGLKAAGHA